MGVIRHGKVASSPGTVGLSPLSLYNTSFEVSFRPMLVIGHKRRRSSWGGTGLGGSVQRSCGRGEELTEHLVRGIRHEDEFSAPNDKAVWDRLTNREQYAILLLPPELPVLPLLRHTRGTDGTRPTRRSILVV